MTYFGLASPPSNMAAIVLSNGTAITLKLNKKETFGKKRSVSRGAVESGYIISDGTVTEQPTISVEGIITGTNRMLKAFDAIRASNEVTSIQAAFDANELVSVYTSFNAVPNAVFTEFKAEMVAGKNLINITLSAQVIRFANFSRTTGEPPAKKVSDPKGKGTTNGGKKSAEVAGPPSKPDDILHF